MSSSLTTSLSGMLGYQTMLDVTANNISNVDTNGFKSSRVNFADTMYRITESAMAPTGALGGRDPSQIGNGQTVAQVQLNFNQGSVDATGRTMDLALNGDGMFRLQDPSGTIHYSRVGHFGFDGGSPDGTLSPRLVDLASGYIVLDAKDQAITKGKGTIPGGASTIGTLSGNLNPTTASLPFSMQIYKADGSTTMVSGLWKNTGTVTSNTGADTDYQHLWTFTPDAPATVAGAPSITFDATGKPLNPAPFTMTRQGQSITIDPTALTGMAADSVVDGTADGYAAGLLQDVAVDTLGNVNGSYSNGKTATLGQLSIGLVTNPDGLIAEGTTMWRLSDNAGSLTVTVPGGDPTAANAAATAGSNTTITAGALESSNVNVSEEFTRLIVAQRGFQANSKAFQTGDGLLTEVFGLFR